MPAKKTTEKISDSSPVAETISASSFVGKTTQDMPEKVIPWETIPPVPEKLSVYETALRLIAGMGDMQRAGDAIAIAKKALDQ